MGSKGSAPEMSRLEGQGQNPPPQDRAPTNVLYPVCHSIVRQGLGPDRSTVPNITRADWRDAIRHPNGLLSPTARHVALTMADYWPKVEGDDLWCAIATIAGHTGLSERTIIRAIKEIVEKGYAVQTSPKSQYRSPRYRVEAPVVPEVQTCQPGMSGHANVSHPDMTESQVTLDNTPYVNPYPASPMAAPARRAAPPAASPTKKRMTRTEDRTIWRDTIEADYADYSKAELDEIYAHWNTRYNWPGCFARDLQEKGNLDGFLGGQGIDLGLYDEADTDPWDQSKSA